MAQGAEIELDLDISIIRMLAKVGHELYMSQLIGNGPPSMTRRWKRMEDVKPGDIVIEVSTGGWWRRDTTSTGDRDYICAENACGILEKVTQEPFPREDGEPPWDEKEEGRPEPLERVFYIKRLHYTDDSAPFRWTNARFVTVLPVGGWAKWDDETG
jgi:hypothetical protein